MTLDNLLRRIRDGHATADELAACRSLVATDLRVPDEIREDLFTDDPAGDAAGLLALFGRDDLGLAAALHEELDNTFDAAWLELPFGIPLADAVCAEAGSVDLAADVAIAVGHSGLPSLASALAAEVGPVDLWSGVAAELGIRSVPVAEAVRAEGGTVSLWPAIAAEIAPRPAAVRPANNNRWWASGLLAAAAAALLFVNWPVPVTDDAIVFAGSAETRVEALVSSDRVTVMQLEGDEGALILWIEDNVPGEVL